jgi:hypothetical protein
MNALRVWPMWGTSHAVGLQTYVVTRGGHQTLSAPA